MTMRTCPACNQEVAANQLGGLVLHHDGPIICPGYVATPEAKPKRGRRKKGGDSHVSTDRQTHEVGNDPGSTVGSEATPGGPPSQEPERVAASDDGQPYGQPYVETLRLAAEKAMLDEAENAMMTVGRSFAGTSTPATPVKARRRRSAPQYLVVEQGMVLEPTEAAAREKIKRRLAEAPDALGKVYAIYSVRLIATIAWRIQETRAGRIRKPRSEP